MHSLSRGNKKINFSYLLLGVLALHGTFMLFQFRNQYEMTSVKKPAPFTVKLVPVDAVIGKARPQTNSHKKQIVQSEDSANTEKKPDAFLSDKDRSFDRQTVSKNIETFKRAAKGNGEVSQKASKPEVAQQPAKPNFKDIKLSDIGMGQMPAPQVTRAPASTQEKGMKNGNAANADGISATNDYVQEVGLGDFTHLNTVEFKFYGFYHRIRQKLEQFWGNSIQEKSQLIFRSGRKIASADYVTSLQVTLDAKGEIVGVKILGASGVKELDDAAVESFNQAGPFPNPPKELLVNGKATIEWGFVVKS